MTERRLSRWRTAPSIILGFLALAAIRPTGAVAQVSAEASARRLKPAPGLEATLWASEPMLVNPTNIDIDSRGRVWVAEGLQLSALPRR